MNKHVTEKIAINTVPNTENIHDALVDLKKLDVIKVVKNDCIELKFSKFYKCGYRMIQKDVDDILIISSDDFNHLYDITVFIGCEILKKSLNSFKLTLDKQTSSSIPSKKRKMS